MADLSSMSDAELEAIAGGGSDLSKMSDAQLEAIANSKEPSTVGFTGPAASGIGSKRTGGFLGMFSIPNIVEGIYNAAKSAPGVTKQVMEGKLDPASEQGIRQIAPLGGLAMLPSAGRTVARPNPAAVNPEVVAAAANQGYRAAEAAGTTTPREAMNSGLSAINRDIAGDIHPALTPITTKMLESEAGRYAPPPRDYMAPMTNPERIVGAAVRHNGEVFTAPIHGPAYEAAAQKYGLGLDELWRNVKASKGDGFVTSTGRFVDRAEAKKIADRQSQLAPETDIYKTANAEQFKEPLTAAPIKESPQVPVVRELQKFREQLNGAIQDSSMGNKDRAAAITARNRVDLLMQELAPEEAATLGTAHKNYGAVMRHDALQNLKENALDQAGANASGRGLENALTQQIKAFIKRDDRGHSRASRSGFTEHEIGVMEKYTREGVPGRDLIRYIGNLLGGGGGLGAVFAGHALGPAAPVVGYGLRALGNSRAGAGLDAIAQQTLQRAPAAAQPLRIRVGLPRPNLPPATLGYPTFMDQ